jgi:uncharacterized protein YdeI (YjbR/CyaY-like superfamily)
MGANDHRIDTYISNANDFAKPVLNQLRKLIHQACPDVSETIKWGFPHFEYKGMLCYMAAFKQHCTFGFWKGTLMKDKQNVMTNLGESAMGHFGKIKNVNDLPANKILLAYLKEAVQLNEDGIKLPPKKISKIKMVQAPSDLKKALAKNKAAAETYESFSNSNKKDYVDWLEEAKTDSTRTKRLEQAVLWMAEGKVRNWKYIKK